MLLLTLAHSFLRKAARLKIIIFNSGRLQISRHIRLVATYPAALKTIILQYTNFIF